MKIVFYHEGVLPIQGYGGIERMIFWHMRELVRQGHEVVLIADGRSHVEQWGIQLIPIVEKDFRPLIPKDADILHLYYPPLFPVDLPIIIHLGCNGKPGEIYHPNTVFVSHKHALNHQSNIFVYNALDLEEYPFESRVNNSWENFLFLAKASWKVKNVKHCIKACRQVKKNLFVVGGKSWFPSRYIHFQGVISGAEKISIMKKCDALLFPVRWEEPFGLAIIEAMALGLPVIGSPHGSLPELITEETGFICENFESLVEVISQQRKVFNAEKIRNYVEENFAIRKYTQEFLKLYQRVIRGEILNAKVVQSQFKQSAEELLPF